MGEISQRDLEVALSISNRVLQDSSAGKALKTLSPNGSAMPLYEIIGRSMAVTYAARGGIANQTGGPAEFVNSYAIYAGALAGESCLDSEGVIDATGYAPDKQLMWIGNATQQQIQLCNILDQALADRRNPGPHEAVSAYFDYLADTASARAFSPEFKEYLASFQADPLTVNGLKLDGKHHFHATTETDIGELAGYDYVRSYFDDLTLICQNSEQVNQVFPVRELLPSGIFITGPPGTGKNAQARRFTQKAGLPFESISLSAIVDPYFGAGERKLEGFYKRLSKKADETGSPIAILFIDEIEGLVPQRLTNNDGGASLRLVNTFNSCTGRESPYPNVMVVGASNLPQVADSAVTRAGRLGEIIFMPAPDKKDLTSVVDYLCSLHSGAIDVDASALTETINNEQYAAELMQNPAPPKFDGFTPAVVREIRNLTVRQHVLEHLKNGEQYLPPATRDLQQNLRDYASERGVKI